MVQLIKPVALAALFATACCHTESGQMASADPRPAVLASADQLQPLKSALGLAIKRADPELGVSDPVKTPTFVVKPPGLHPEDTASMARPTPFRLELHGDACVAVNVETGDIIMLEDVACVPFEGASD